MDTSYLLKGAYIRSRVGSPSPVRELRDESRNQNNGTFSVNTTWQQLTNTPAPGLWLVRLDTAATSITCADTPSLRSQILSITFWTMVATAKAPNLFLLYKTNGVDGWYVQIQGSFITFARLVGGVIISTPLRTFTQLTWHFVVAVYDGQNLYLYLDGVLVAGPTADNRTVLTNFPLEIAKNPVSITGLISPPRIKSYAMSFDEQARILQRERRFFGVY